MGKKHGGRIQAQTGIGFDVTNCALKTPQEHGNYKFLVLLDGVVAAFRSKWYFLTGSLILATGVYLDARTQLLQPWIHFIPFSLILYDLEHVLLLVSRYPKYA